MRAVVSVNPHATSTTPRTLDVLLAALAAAVDATVVLTKGRNHASELAHKAAIDGAGAVVVLGGDGTVNEAVNGLLADTAGDTDPRPDAELLPRLAVVPGGNGNVFAGALGLPREPVEATGVLLTALAQDHTHTIGLGRADERYFTFGAGLGIDAEIVDRVERRRHDGASSSTGLWVRTAARHLAGRGGRDAPRLTVDPGPESAEPLAGLGTLVVSNTAVWTYLGDRALSASPDASFDLGLDALGLRGARRTTSVRVAAGLLRGHPPHRAVARWHDVSHLRVSATEPIAAQVDGDALGPVDAMTLRAVSRALRVVTPVPDLDRAATS
jgi:diacylglycerol kinase family enzyme